VSEVHSDGFIPSHWQVAFECSIEERTRVPLRQAFPAE
jgi:hypothetical protein